MMASVLLSEDLCRYPASSYNNHGIFGRSTTWKTHSVSISLNKPKATALSGSQGGIQS
jgi:hypothetical protein